MNAVGRLGSYISRGVYTVSGPFHPFGGCVDIIVVEQQDGTFKSSPWYVRFGKFQGVLKTREKVVRICVNGLEADFHMFLDHKGEAFFLREVDSIGEDGEEDRIVLNNSSSGDDEASSLTRTQSSSGDNGVGAVARTNSRRARILGLVFGRGSRNETKIGDHKRTDSMERAEFAANLLDVKWSTNLKPNSALICGDERLSDENGSGEVRPFIYCESSESSILRKDCSSEHTRETMYISSGETGELRVHSELLRARTESLSEDTVVEHLSEDYELGIPSMEKLGDFLDRTNPICNADDGASLVELESCSRDPVLGLANDFGELSKDICTVSSFNNSFCQSEDEKNTKIENLLDDLRPFSKFPKDCVPIEERDVTSSLCLEEQLVFGDIEEFDTGDIHSSTKEGTESSPEGSGDMRESVDTMDHLNSVSEKSVLEDQSRDFESSAEIFQILSSSPIAISGAHNVVDEGVVRLTESLPNLWTKIPTFEADGVNCLSHSLDSNSKILDWALQSKEISTAIKSDGEKEQQLVLEPSDTNDAKETGEVRDLSSTAPIGDPSNGSTTTGGNWRIWPFSRSRKSSQSDLSDVRSSVASEVSIGVVQGTKMAETKVARKMVRVPCPTSEQLASLNLKDGMNTITFTFLTPMLGKQQVDARIFLWKWNTQIVISDVDGTITRSDVLGQFMPLVGVDWSHLGVAHLFSAIKENGYQLLFLSARAISQAYITRQFLFNLKQDGKALPDGPVVISPDGLFPSLYREVIRRAPHEFKIACLEEIRSLFPPDSNPFYAGFGNRDTDEVSYLKVGIPKGKIFIINPKGEVAVNRRVDTKSYKSIHALVNGMFPPTGSSEQEDFNSWNFWKLPPPLIDE